MAEQKQWGLSSLGQHLQEPRVRPYHSVPPHPEADDLGGQRLAVGEEYKRLSKDQEKPEVPGTRNSPISVRKQHSNQKIDEAKRNRIRSGKQLRHEDWVKTLALSSQIWRPRPASNPAQTLPEAWPCYPVLWNSRAHGRIFFSGL